MRASAAARLLCTIIAATAPTPTDAARPAEVVYRNGRIYTANARNAVCQAVAIHNGQIIYVGGNAGVGRYVFRSTKTIDLHGRSAMPGIIDAHMHPFAAGVTLVKCNLNYESLTVPEFQARIQRCLDATKAQEPDGWLEVLGWYQQGMQPDGVPTSRATLDVLKTSRPIIVYSTYGHTVLANTRALALAKITRATPDVVGGKIARDSAGEPTGILEDTAFRVFNELVPKATPEQNVAAAGAALDVLSKQGVTTFLDPNPSQEAIAAFAEVERSGGLTARAHFAPRITPEEGKDPKSAIAKILALRSRYDQGPIERSPRLTVRNAKLFLDGVIAAPSFTGAVLEPYRVNIGTQKEPRWQNGPSRGPDVYFPASALKHLLIGLGKAGIDPHLHADGDRAVREALDAVEAMRDALPDDDIRPAIAHNEMVSPQDFPRFAKLKAFPVLSFQWGRPMPDTVDSILDYIGPERARTVEPAGLLAKQGATVAFGSDWPADPLDEWFAFKVGVTRSAAPSADPKYAGRLGIDPGLTPIQVLRAATINAARALHQDEVTGSLEVGKFADLIVLDGDPLRVPAEEIAKIKVLQTVIGGRVIYEALGFQN
jgi:predicted amidohydrolase YtcJ